MRSIRNYIREWNIKKERKIYEEYYKQSYETINQLLFLFRRKKRSIAIWGAGLKGTAFLHLFDRERHYISYVFDINKKKYGTLMESGHYIIDYKKCKGDEVILVINNKHENEVAGIMEEISMYPLIISVDHIVLGDLSLQETIKMYEV